MSTSGEVANLRGEIAGMRSELETLRSELLQALTRDLGETRQNLDDVRNETRAARAQLEELLSRPADPRLEPDRPQPHSTDPDNEHPDLTETDPAAADALEHTKRLAQAAGIGEAEIECHRDTWAFIVEQAAAQPHFRVPEIVLPPDDGDDAEPMTGLARTRVQVSGRTLIAILIALHAVRHGSNGRARTDDPGDRALATTLYVRFAEVVDRAEPRNGTNGAATTRIVVDDRATEPTN
jgi:hypothetical protein